MNGSFKLLHTKINVHARCMYVRLCQQQCCPPPQTIFSRYGPKIYMSIHRVSSGGGEAFPPDGSTSPPPNWSASPSNCPTLLKPHLHETTFLEPILDSAPCKCNRSRSRFGLLSSPALCGLSPDSNPFPVGGPV